MTVHSGTTDRVDSRDGVVWPGGGASIDGFHGKPRCRISDTAPFPFGFLVPEAFSLFSGYYPGVTAWVTGSDPVWSRITVMRLGDPPGPLQAGSPSGWLATRASRETGPAEDLRPDNAFDNICL